MLPRPLSGFRTSLVFAWALSAALSACGGGEPEPKTQADAVEPEHERGERSGGMSASSEIGALDEQRVDNVFKRSLGALEECLHQGAERVEFLGGSVSFFVEVDGDGHAEQAFLEHSTLGDRETERCMLSALKSKHWPKPVGGMHGLARKSFDFDPPNDVRPPLEWDAEQAKPALKKLGGKLDECRGQSSGTFEATAYVSPEGQVIAASVTPPNAEADAAVDCLVEAIRSASFPSPGSWAAKVTFPL